MSSSRFALPFTLELVPSRILIVSIIVCHLLTFASLFVSVLPLLVKITLGLPIIASFVFGYARYGYAQSRWFVRAVHCSTEQSWTLYNAGGREKPARLVRSYVHPYLVILNFAFGTVGRCSVLLLPDSADSDQVRRLRVLLRTMKQDE